MGYYISPNKHKKTWFIEIEKQWWYYKMCSSKSTKNVNQRSVLSLLLSHNFDQQIETLNRFYHVSTRCNIFDSMKKIWMSDNSVGTISIDLRNWRSIFLLKKCSIAKVIMIMIRFYSFQIGQYICTRVFLRNLLQSPGDCDSVTD